MVVHKINILIYTKNKFFINNLKFSNTVLYHFKILFRIICAFLLGIAVSLAIIQEDPWFKQLIESFAQQSFSEIVQVPFYCKVKEINLISGEIIFHSLSAKAEDGSWSFQCDGLNFHFSWFSFFSKGIFDTRFTLYNVTASSYTNENYLAIIKPLKDIIEAPSTIPMAFKRCLLRNASLYITEPNNKYNGLLYFSSDIFYSNSVVHTKLVCNDGTFSYEKAKIIKNISGSVIVDIPVDNVRLLSAKVNLFADYLGNAAQNHSILIGAYKNGQGIGSFYNADKSLIVNACAILRNSNIFGIDLTVNGTLASLISYAPLLKLNNIKDGICNAQAHIDIAPEKISYNGTAVVENAKYDTHELKKISLMVQGNNSEGQATIDILDLVGSNISSSWTFDINKKQTAGKLILTKPVSLFSIFVDQGTHCSLEFNNNQLTVDYNVNFMHQERKVPQVVSGQAQLADNKLMFNGKLNGQVYYGQFMVNPFSIEKLSFTNLNEKNLITVEKDKESEKINGVVDYELVKELLYYFYDYDYQGEGKIEFDLTFNDNRLRSKINLKDTNIKVPYVHNLIKRAKALLEIDFINRELVIKDLCIDLHKGAIWSLYSTIRFSPDGVLTYAHIPLSCSNCLITWNKEFFGLVSGAVTATYQNSNLSLVKGYLKLDRSQLRSNLLSWKVQQDLVRGTIKSLTAYKQDFQLDLQIATGNHIEVNTPFLKTNARINLDVKGTILNPEISGIIELMQGSLAFPYKPLYINVGKLYLMPQQADDLAIELIAKNKIKKYMITMTISGSLHQPKINFESYPSLQEEQIITLLLSGSEEGSLYLVMPNMIMQNLESLLFGPTENSSTLHHYFKNVLKPFKNVRIMPTLNDGAISGKVVRGAVEIDINDNLRAKIQNNLDLSEDTEIEVEYALSNDVSIKALKNDRGGLGAELEMRWKF